MWYFAWILGTLLACSFGVITALALEHVESPATHIPFSVCQHSQFLGTFVNLKLMFLEINQFFVDRKSVV